MLAGIAAGTAADEADGGPAAETDFDWSALILPPPSADADHSRIFSAYTDSLANREYTEAEVAAKQMIEQSNAASVAVTAERARALHNLAIVQHAQGSYESAIQNYTAAVSFVAEGENNLSDLLIMPLRGLAAAYQSAGLVQEAYATYDRALHVSNVNLGPHSFAQLPILNSKLDSYLAHGDTPAALDVLDRITGLYTRRFPKRSMELLPAYYQQAAVYRSLRMYSDEYDAWRNILFIKRDHLDKYDLELIEPHLRIAAIGIRDLRNSIVRNVTTSPAELHLKKALEIAEKSPEQSWEAKRDCLLALADFYTLFDMKGRARRYYRTAWDLLSSAEETRAARAKAFDQPVPLVRNAPDPYANFEYDRNRGEVPHGDYSEGELVVSFTVNDRGRTTNQRLVAADPEDFEAMERRVRNAIETFVFRPRFVDGRPAAAENQRYTAIYYYLPSEYQAALEKSARRSPR